MNNSRSLIVIPARRGSKEISRNNYRLLAGYLIIFNNEYF